MSADLVPFAETDIESAADPAQYVVLACERAKTWLANALEHGDIASIVELKSQAEAIRVYTQQKELGRDAELSAQEIVRRAERGIGVAIRRGQEAGEIAKRGDIGADGGDARRVRNQHLGRPAVMTGIANGDLTAQVYVVTDGISDEQFEEAITEAKAEGNLSRANVVRKVKSEPSMKATGDRNALLYKTRRPNANRTMQAIVDGAVVPNAVMEFVDYSALDRDRLQEWVNSLAESIRMLRRIQNDLTKELTR